MYNVAITGTRGFLGRYVCDVLAKSHVEINPIPLYSGSSDFSVHPSILTEPSHNLEGVLRSSSALLLLGTYSSCQPYDAHSACAMQNVYMNLNLLQRAYSCGVRKVLAIGTCFEFGHTARTEQPLHPLSRLAPIGSYPSSKAAFCLMALDWAREHSVDLIYSRLFQVYGEGEHPSRLFPSLLKKARSGQNFELKQPNLVRDFMHASEAAQQIASTLNFLLNDRYTIFPRVEHICTGVGTSLFHFADRIWREEKASGHLIMSNYKSTRAVDLHTIVGMPLNVSYE